MGQCLCCEEKDEELSSFPPPSSDFGPNSSPPQQNISVDRDRIFPSHIIPASEAIQLPHIDDLVRQTLAVIGSLVEKYLHYLNVLLIQIYLVRYFYSLVIKNQHLLWLAFKHFQTKVMAGC